MAQLARNLNMSHTPFHYWAKASEARLSRRRLLAVGGTLTAGAALLAACGGGKTGGSATKQASGLISQAIDTTKEAKRGGVMPFYRNREVGGSDPHITGITAPGTAYTYSRLFRGKPGYLGPASVDFIGDLSDSWEFSADKLQLTIK